MEWQGERPSVSAFFLEGYPVLWLALSNFCFNFGSVSFYHLLISENLGELSNVLPAVTLPCWYRRVIFDPTWKVGFDPLNQLYFHLSPPAREQVFW